MPVRYVVENTGEESVVIDGLGVIPPKTEKTYDDEAVASFQYTRGLLLTQVRLPEDVVLTVEVAASTDDE